MAAKKTTGTSAKKTAASKTGTARKTNSRSTSSYRKSTAGKSSARKTTRKPNTKKAAPKPQKTPEEMEIDTGKLIDILFVAVIGITVLTTLFNFGLGGVFGSKISDFLFGCFGFLQNLLPFIVLGFIFFIIANKNNRFLPRKIVGFIGTTWFMMAFLGLVTSGFSYDTRIIDYFRDSRYDHLGAGLVGGILLRFFGMFGMICTWILVILGILFSVILLTQKPILSGILNLDSPDLFGGVFTGFFGMVFSGIIRFFKKITGHFTSVKLPKIRKGRSAILNFSLKREEDEDFYEDEEEDYEDYEDGDEELYDEVPVSADEDEDSHSRKVRRDLAVKPFILNHDDMDAEDEEAEEDDDTDLRTQKSSSPVTTIRRSSSIFAKDKADEDLSDELPEEEALEEEAIPTASNLYDDEDEDEEDFSWFDELDENGALKKKTSLTSPEQADEADSSISRKSKHYTDQKELDQVTKSIDAEARDSALPPKKEYKFPPIKLLAKGKSSKKTNSSELINTAHLLQDTYASFGVDVDVSEDEISCGPTVTQYQVRPGSGVKVSRIVSLADDIKLALGTADVRFEAPIPGKNVVGIEVPNKTNQAVYLRDLIETEKFDKMSSKLAFGLGMNISGEPEIADIAKMPHLLIAGATGSGKSVCINTLIMSILYKASPDEVKLIMIDPKVVELSVYNGIPHLLIPVVTDPKKASGALNWAVQEMTKRYNAFAEWHVRDMKGYNQKIASIPEEERLNAKPFPQIVIIVDELADLMMVAPGEVEESICRLAQLARAAGIHLIIATQRPSVNVITGLIKANMPTRIAFSVSSGIDSRTILDMVGAEKLLGKGDMLYKPQNLQKPVRLQGSYVSDEEVESVVKYLKDQKYGYTSLNGSDIEKEIATASISVGGKGGDNSGSERDELFMEAGKFIIEKDKASIGMLQRIFKIGFNRAARIMDQLCDAGVVGPEEGTKPRKILMSQEEFEQYVDEYL